MSGATKGDVGCEQGDGEGKCVCAGAELSTLKGGSDAGLWAAEETDGIRRGFRLAQK